MNNFDFRFNATEFDPNTAMGQLPIGAYAAAVSNLEVSATKDNSGGKLVIEFTILSGPLAGRKTVKNLNLWNQSEEAVRIARGELSAICHVTGVMVFNNLDELQRLKGIPMQIVVDYQKQPKSLPQNMTPEEWKAKGYTEVSGVRDVNGNDPKKGVPSQVQANNSGMPSGNFSGGQPANNNANNAPNPQQNNQGNNQGNNSGNAGGNWGGGGQADQNAQGNNSGPQGGGGGQWGNGGAANPSAGQGGGNAGGWGGGNNTGGSGNAGNAAPTPGWAQ